MIHFTEFTLANGLRCIVHEDFSTPMAVLNVMYDVGSRDEDAEHTGFAHLFEHLMFSGSVNIPSYDEPLQRVGGENNAFTSRRRHQLLPLAAGRQPRNRLLARKRPDAEPGFLRKRPRSAAQSGGGGVQAELPQPALRRRVAPAQAPGLPHPPLPVEHHRQGDCAHRKCRDGRRARLFQEALRPAECRAGGGRRRERRQPCASWPRSGSGPLPADRAYQRHLPHGARPNRTPGTSRPGPKCPLSALYKAYHMPARGDARYHAVDLLSDMLGHGKSARLHQRLVKEQALFNNISASLTGSLDPGLLVISGKLNEGVDLKAADAAVEAVVAEFLTQDVDAQELQKVKNQAESSLVFGEIDLLNRALNLAYSKLQGDANLVNDESRRIQAVTVADVRATAQLVLRPENCSTLYYEATAVAEPA